MKYLLLIMFFYSYSFADNREFVSSSSDAIVVLMPVAAFANTFAFNDSKGTLQLVLGLAASQATTQTLKLLVDKERPNKKDLRSFPSGHSTTAFQTASFIHIRYGIKYAVGYYAFASYVVWARIYSRNHFIEDTAVGASIGVLSSWLLTDTFQESKVSFIPEYESKDNFALHVSYKF